MEKIIKSIRENQGISLANLSKEVNASFWDLQKASKGKSNYLNKNHIKCLLKIYNLPSAKLIPKHKFITNLDNKVYLDVYNLLSRKTRSGYNLYAKSIGRKIKFWYQPLTRKKGELILPNYIPLDEFFITGLGLSIGDGLNNPNLTNTHYNFTNTNLDLIRYNYFWLTKCFKLNNDKIQVYGLKSTDYDEDRDKKIISGLLKIDNHKIKIYKTNRNNKLDIMIQLGDVIFQTLYLKLFDRLKSIIVKNKAYRRAFLKGLFAAEGHVKHSIYGTIESLTFAFNPKTEQHIAGFVKKCLEKEGIHSKIDKNGHLYFCGYEQMLKFYLGGMISLNKEKEDKFLNLCKVAKVQLHMNKGGIDCFGSIINKITKENKFNLNSISRYRYKRMSKFGKMDLDLAKNFLNSKDLIQKVDYVKVTNSNIKDRNCINFIINHLS